MPHHPPHVVLAAGPFGRLVTARLAATGRRVRLVRFAGEPSALPGIENVLADPSDGSAVRAFVRGAEAVYHSVHPGFLPPGWEGALPRVHANLLDAAGRAGARLVVLDGLEAYGPGGDRPIAEHTPHAPCTREGELRARLLDRLAAAACRGDVRAVVGRASDLFGPAAWSGPLLGERFWRAVVAGRPGAVPGDPHTAHTFHFTADVAAAMVLLGLDPASDGLWMLPCAPAVSTGALVRHLAVALGRPISIGRVPRAALAARAGGREPGEHAYRWETPFVVDDARFRERYGDLATPLDVAAGQTAGDALARLAAPARRVVRGAAAAG